MCITMELEMMSLEGLPISEDFIIIEDYAIHVNLRVLNPFMPPILGRLSKGKCMVC